MKFSAENPPSPQAVCRGSYALGSNCGRCERCKQDRDRIFRVINAAEKVVDAWGTNPNVELAALANLNAAVFLYRGDRT